MQINSKDLVNSTSAIDLLKISPRQFFYMAENKELPEPVVISGIKFYKKHQIQELKKERDKEKAQKK